MAGEAKAPEFIEDIEVRIVDYLATHREDRYMTVNRLALALGANELLVADALKNLRSAGQVIEREDKDWGTVTYHYQEPKPVEETPSEVPTPLPETVMLTSTVKEEYDIGKNGERQPKGMSEAYWCGEPGCKRWFDSKVGRANHRRFAHNIHAHERNIGRHRSKQSLEIDKQIKELYPKKTPSEISDVLGLSYPAVAARLHKMHDKGEVKNYCGPKPQSCPSESIEPVRDGIAPQRSPQIQSISESNSLNISQLLKLSSENQVAVVNAILEVIDERGSQYEISITRTGKSVDGQGPIPMEFTKDVWEDLVDLLEWQGDTVRDLVEDDDVKEDNPEWYSKLIRQQKSLNLIVENVRRDVKIPKEEKVK